MCNSMFDSLIENECIDLLNNAAAAIEDQQATVRSYAMSYDVAEDDTTALRNVVIETGDRTLRLEVR